MGSIPARGERSAPVTAPTSRNPFAALRQIVEQMGRMAAAIESLRAEVLPLNARQFGLMVGGPLAELDSLAKQAAALTGEPTPSDLDDLAMTLCMVYEDGEGFGHWRASTDEGKDRWRAVARYVLKSQGR